MDIETIVIILIVVFLLWWLFSGDSEKQVIEVKHDVVVPVEISPEITEQVPTQAPTEVSQVAQINEKPKGDENVVEKQKDIKLVKDEPILESPMPVVSETTGNSVVSQQAIVVPDKNTAVMHTATGNVVPLKQLQLDAETKNPNANDDSKVGHIAVQSDKNNNLQPNALIKVAELRTVAKKMFSDKTDSESSTSSESSNGVKSMAAAGVPAAINSFESHASADHRIANSGKKKKDKKKKDKQ